MARLTAQDMVDMVRDSLGGETSETISDTRILRYLNQSYLEIAAAAKPDQLRSSTTITTSSGTSDYELSVDTVLMIDDIIDTTNTFKLYPMNESQYWRYNQGGTQTGTPVYWFIDGVGSNGRWNIKLWPTPAGTYSLTVSITKKPTELVISPLPTSTVIPEQWDDSIIYRAVSRGWMQLGDTQMADKWRSNAKANDRAAINSTYHPSQIIERTSSIVGKALQDG